MWTSVALWAFGGLFFIWLGYPLLIAGVAALRPRRSVPAVVGSEPTPKVSVIIASREPPAVVRDRIADALAVRYPGDALEIVVGLDATVDPASYADVFAGDSRVRLVRGDPGGKTGGLNAAVRAATGGVLVFTDSWQRFDPDAVALLTAALRDPQVGAVSGYLEIATGTGGSTVLHSYMRYELWLREQEARIHSPPGLVGAIHAMPRSAWEPLPPGLILDDVYSAMRLVLQGRRIAFERRAITHDLRPPEPGSEHRRKVRTMTGIFQLCAWLPAILNPLRNAIWAQFVAHKLLRLATPYLALIAVVASIGAGVTWLLAHRVSLVPLLLVVAAGLALSLAMRKLRGRAWRIASWVVAVQSAAVIATVNGVRREWDVWRP